MRKGRFDEIFFVDLPRSKVRHAIIEIHLKNRAQDLTLFALDEISAATRGFSGAEIEQAIVAALYAAHAQRKPLNTEHILAEVARTQPLSVVMDEPIATLRTWARGRTVPSD